VRAAQGFWAPASGAAPLVTESRGALGQRGFQGVAPLG